MPGCQPCAPADGVLIVGVRVLEYLCCPCGRHVACLLLSQAASVYMSNIFTKLDITEYHFLHFDGWFKPFFARHNWIYSCPTLLSDTRQAVSI
jgi:hypothetical protein